MGESLISRNVAVITMGCPKNQVDSEFIMGYLRDNGFHIVKEPENADIVVVNTCAFLKEAVEESIGEIKEIASNKDRLGIKKLVVTGCLVERFKKGIQELLPEVDLVFGIDRLSGLIQILENGKNSIPEFSQRFIGDSRLPRYNPTWQPHHYLKISEGCDRRCSFCIIPHIRGRMRSRKIEDIVDEAKKWLDLGKKELVIVSQDPTSYGYDIYGKGNHLVSLLEKLDSLNGNFWIRLLYLHPSGISRELIEFLSTSHHVVPYLDVPIQHISSRILRLMRRTGEQKAVERAIKLVRYRLSDWYLRTEIIVGFPSETDEEYSHLLRFIEEYAFERVAVFPFSPEPEAPASRYPDRISSQVLFDRYEVAMTVSQGLSLKAQKRLLNKTLDVLVEGKRDGHIIGRTFYDAPEIDFNVKLKLNSYEAGRIIRCKITGVDEEFDLEAICNEGI